MSILVVCKGKNKEFYNIDKAIEYAKMKSLAVGPNDDVRIKIRTRKDPFVGIFRYNYELQIYHDGSRVYFDDPEQPNGYKKESEEQS